MDSAMGEWSFVFKSFTLILELDYKLFLAVKIVIVSN